MRLACMSQLQGLRQTYAWMGCCPEGQKEWQSSKRVPSRCHVHTCYPTPKPTVPPREAQADNSTKLSCSRSQDIHISGGIHSRDARHAQPETPQQVCKHGEQQERSCRAPTRKRARAHPCPHPLYGRHLACAAHTAAGHVGHRGAQRIKVLLCTLRGVPVVGAFRGAGGVEAHIPRGRSPLPLHAAPCRMRELPLPAAHVRALCSIQHLLLAPWLEQQRLVLLLSCRWPIPLRTRKSADAMAISCRG